MRRRLIITAALAATAALAVGPGNGAAAKGKRVTHLSCAFELYAQGPPPSANSFGLVSCPRPLGDGLHYGSSTMTPTGPRQGTVAVSFKKYFDRGTISGTVAGTLAAASPMNIIYNGTVTMTGGTGRFKHVSASGRLACTSADGGARKSCTVNLRLRGI